MYYINVVKRKALLLILVLFSTYHQVSFGGLNDPMSPKLPEGHRYKQGLLLSAIGFSDRADHYVVVNDHILRVGDEISGFLVKKIEKKMVILVKIKDNSELVLEI